MTKFEDGPAKGVILQLQRSPMFLRVTEMSGKWDALDQWEDIPHADEKIYVYKLSERLGRCHVCRGGGRGGSFEFATYRVVENQPPDEALRDFDVWKGWVYAQ